LNISNYQKEFRTLLVITIALFAISLIYFSNIIIEEIKKREINTIDRYAKFIEIVANSENESINYFIDDILIKNHSIPVIITDSNNKILDSKNIFENNDNYNEDLINRSLVLMKKKYKPIIINILDEKEEIIDYQLVYYNNSKVLNILIYAPYFILFLTILILLSIYLIFYYSNKSERDGLWTGLAKETAHQLGTPLSSLIGWNEYLKNNNKVDKKYVGSEIDKDLERLKIITDRFSSIGSKPKLQNRDLKDSIKKSIEYLEKRLSSQIRTELNLEKTKTYFNEQLFSWVIENLYKNSIDSIGEKGNIQINLYRQNNNIVIDFIDDGIGIKRSNFTKIFNPGYTTKKRGWGLGLTLVSRIISDYHKGKIFVLQSKQNIKTTIRIELKKYD
tara:strand:+ start:590 stop:1759 length:1170 start_codon:yes stop_codon:yes gene_type:complete